MVSPRSFLLVACLIACACGGDDDGNDDPGTDAGAPEPEPDPQLDALRQLEELSRRPLSVEFRHGFPGAILGAIPVSGDDPVEKAQGFLDDWKVLYRLDDPQLELGVRRVAGDDDEHVVFHQTYKGLPVFGGEIVAGIEGDELFMTIGSLVTKGLELDVTPLITPAQAEELVREAVGGRTSATIGETTLLVYDPSLLDAEVDPEPHLVYQVNLPDAHHLMDAISGQLLLSLSTDQSAGLSDYDLDLEDANLNNAQETSCFTSTEDDDAAADEGGIYPDYADDADVVEIYDYTQFAYLFYEDNFGRTSYDDDEAQVEIYAHVKWPDDEFQDNAKYSPSCDLFQVSDRVISEDVIGHEYTHAVINATSDLFYGYQSGALNESYADVMAELAENDGMWLMGEDTLGGIIRNLADPPAKGQPDHSFDYVVTSDDEGGVHSNSGIPNKAAWLITVGGTHHGYTTEGIGRQKAMSLYYKSMIVMFPGTDFTLYRNFLVGMALAWADVGKYGFTAQDACDVRNGLAAVGMGKGDIDCDGVEELNNVDADNDYIHEGIDNCDAVPNPSQADHDKDGMGDACDDDDDNDTVPDGEDNCPLANSDQLDQNGNGVGDRCEDFDSDGVLDDEDNCPGDANSTQTDSDDDGDGDACDPDNDGDGVTGLSDNCPFTANADQADTDLDGIGDACDACADVSDPVDGWTAGIPELGIDPAPLQKDYDQDGIPDACDPAPFGGISARIGTEDLTPENTLIDADGANHTLNIAGSPLGHLSVPIPLCPAGCPAWFPQDYELELALVRIDGSVGVWLTDENGRMMSHTHMDTAIDRTLRFSPQGGRSYFLNVGLAPTFTGSSFQLALSAN
ncbi:MAG TPA: M4 family metallopeptidase [Kofleriaceae bacterium]